MNTDILNFIKNNQQSIDSSLIFSITDKLGNILYVNKKFCEISGYTQDEIKGKNYSLIKSGFHSDKFYKKLWNTINYGKIWQGKIKNKAKNGTFFWLDTLIFPVFDKNQNIIQFFTIRIPMETNNKYNNNMNNTQNDIEKLLFMISHNVRKPISTTLGLINLIEEETSHNSNSKDLKKLFGYLKTNIVELDTFTREMNELLCRFSLRQRG